MVILNISNVPDNPCNGVSNIVPQIVNWQNKCGAESALINTCGELSGCDFQLEYKNNFEINKLPEPFNKPDIVVFHEVYKKQYPAIAKRLLKANIPYIIVPHSCLTKAAQNKKRLKKIAGNLLLFNRFISSAVAIQFVSEKENEATAFGKNRIVAPFGVNIPAEQKKSFSEAGLKIVYVGRLDVQIKGLDLMLEAAEKVAAFLRENDYGISIYGPQYGGNFSAVKRIIEDKNLNDIVSLNDAVYGIEKERVLLNSDVFIQTSRSDALPLSILEALGYGLPCLITEGTCFAEIINEYDAGTGVKTNSDEIAEAIKNIDRLELKNQSNNARRLIEENYSWEALTKNTINKYEELIKKGNN